jgi:DNA-binding MarR family transcriptional regulator
MISVDSNTPRENPDPATAALAALFDAHRSLSDAMDRAIRAGCGFSPAEVDVLETLTRRPDGRQRMVDIADQMCLSKSGVTQIVDRLETAGMVARESSTTDRRTVYAAITTAGRDVLDKAGPVLAALADEHIGSRLHDADLRKLTKALRTIADTSSSQVGQR